MRSVASPIVTLCCLTLLAPVSARQPGRPAQNAAAARTRRPGRGPSSAAHHHRPDTEHAVRVFVYPPPVAPFQNPYVWRFDPLIADLKEMGVVTSNMSEADAFLIVNHIDQPKSDDKVLTN